MSKFYKGSDTFTEKVRKHNTQKIKDANLKLSVDVYRLRQRGWTLKAIREEYDIGEVTVHRLLDVGKKEYERKRDKSGK